VIFYPTLRSGDLLFCAEHLFRYAKRLSPPERRPDEEAALDDLVSEARNPSTNT
jgi:hypothetical protein